MSLGHTCVVSAVDLMQPFTFLVGGCARTALSLITSSSFLSISYCEFLRGPTGPMGPPGECKPDQWRCMSDVNMDLVKPEPRWSWHPIIQQPEPGELGLKLFLSGALVRV